MNTEKILDKIKTRGLFSIERRKKINKEKLETGRGVTKKDPTSQRREFLSCRVNSTV